jgi:hypothetical protein
MTTLSAPTHKTKPSIPKCYIGSPLRFVMLQSEVPPYERLPLAESSLHMRRTRHKTTDVSFHDALHAAMGGSRSSLEHLPRTSEEDSPSRNARKACPSDEKRTLSVTHAVAPQEHPGNKSRKPLHKQNPLGQRLKEKD